MFLCVLILVLQIAKYDERRKTLDFKNMNMAKLEREIKCLWYIKVWGMIIQQLFCVIDCLGCF